MLLRLKRAVDFEHIPIRAVYYRFEIRKNGTENDYMFLVTQFPASNDEKICLFMKNRGDPHPN